MRRTRTSLSLASVVAGSFLGVTASFGGAQALPLAQQPSHAADPAITSVQYYRRGHPYPDGYRSYPYDAHPAYRRGAGVYRCGPYAYKTHLSRKYC